MSRPLGFLRPLPPPSAFFARSLSRSVSTSSPFHASSSPSTSTSDALNPAYFVRRTPSQQLPVYHDAKRGGNLHQTRIRRIEGNVRALRDELQKELQLGDKEITINQLNGHIIIKGWLKKEVAKFLEDRKF